jgi:hypothetical protein
MRTHLARKEPDDVLGGEDAWKNVDKTASESGYLPTVVVHNLAPCILLRYAKNEIGS